MLHVYFISIVICLASCEAAEKGNCPSAYLRFSKDHSFCKPPNPECKIQISSVSKKDIEVILKEHNNYRNNIATGKQNNYPSASNMLEMVWDEELASVAQKKATSCIFAHDCRNCRRVPNFDVGQNLAEQTTTKPNEEPNWPAIIKNWFDEIKFFSKNLIEPFVHKSSYGHFTQVVWAQTWRIGCGYVRHQEGSRFKKLYVCNYGPSGNKVSGSMYKQGKVCSECPSNSCCGAKCTGATFPGLCKITDNKAPVYKTPDLSRFLYYCDFKNKTGCGVISGAEKFKYVTTLSGDFLSITLKGGDESTLLFDTTIKPQQSSFCVHVYYRTSPSKDGDEDGGKITLILEFQKGGRKFTRDLPNYPGSQKHKFKSYSFNFGSKQEVKLALKFSVPRGKPEQIMEVSRIDVENGKCTMEKKN